jgi:hypothetical protein
MHQHHHRQASRTLGNTQFAGDGDRRSLVLALEEGSVGQGQALEGMQFGAGRNLPFRIVRQVFMIFMRSAPDFFMGVGAAQLSATGFLAAPENQDGRYPAKQQIRIAHNRACCGKFLPVPKYRRDNKRTSED